MTSPTSPPRSSSCDRHIWPHLVLETADWSKSNMVDPEEGEKTPLSASKLFAGKIDMSTTLFSILLGFAGSKAPKMEDGNHSQVKYRHLIGNLSTRF